VTKLCSGIACLDSTVGGRKTRTWATLVSVVLQCFLIGLLLLLPLWFTAALPKPHLLRHLRHHQRLPHQSESGEGYQRRRRRATAHSGQNPGKVQVIKEDEAPLPVATTGEVVDGVPGGIPGGQLGGVTGGIISSSLSLSRVPTLSKSVSAAQRVRVSQGVINGLVCLG
jgi:hypothetical protein